MAGVGQTGVWRSGVWVEPLDAEGEFALLATAETTATGRFSFGKPFNLVATADTNIKGAVVEFGDFALLSTADLLFDGDFEARPGQGIFGLSGSADVRFAWVPFLSVPGTSEVGIPDTPAEAIILSSPGDVVVINGITGVVVREATGRMVVVDGDGSVMCIIGPAGLEFGGTPGVQF